MAYPRKEFCVNGHEIAVVGRATNRSCAECARQRTRAWRERNLEYVKEAHRQRRFRRRKLTESEYDALAREQNGLCAICAQPPMPRYGKATLQIDHSHATGMTRGLLCYRCNIGIGQLQDSPDLLRSAIAYLEAWNAIDEGIVAGSDQ